MLPGASLNTESSGEGEGAEEREINSTRTLFSGQKTRTSGYSKIRLRAKLVFTTRKPKKKTFLFILRIFFVSETSRFQLYTMSISGATLPAMSHGETNEVVYLVAV